MFDGVVIGDLYPEHHPRCKSLTVVAARLKEIDRRCRKDIVSGMDPKQAWEKVCWLEIFAFEKNGTDTTFEWYFGLVISYSNEANVILCLRLKRLTNSFADV